ncbi:hypothetical protein TNCV_3634011 [Trichonephila clavipes]|nr:hypothetical protein TNCV_3634011 [Trichonephila clavipes]
MERGRIHQLEVSEEQESPRVSSPGFGNDSKMMLPVRQFRAGRLRTLRGTLGYMLVGRSGVPTYHQLTVACD